MRKKFFLDFDQSLFFTKKSEFDFIKEEYGIELDINAEYGEYSILDTINRVARKEVESFNVFWKNHAEKYLTSISKHHNTLPMPGMVDVVKELALDNDIFVVTARQEIGKPVIKHLINEFIGDSIKDIHCVWRKNGKGFVPTYKKDYILSHDGNKIAFIDDSPKEVLEVSNIIPSYLFDPSELHTNLNNIERLSSWKEIGEKFL